MKKAKTNFLKFPRSLFTLSWKNIWRNKRRAFISIASVFFAVFFCSLMDSYQTGSWEQMINNSLRTQTGHVEIRGIGWWEDKCIDNFMYMDSAIIKKIRELDNIDNLSPRVESFALASFANMAKGIAIIGISPEAEAKKSNLSSHIIQGSYLSETDAGIIIGNVLADYLKVKIGDTIACIGQGHFGASAAALFPIRGIFQFAVGDLNSSVAYASIPAVQQFIEMPNGYSGLLITLKNDKQLQISMNAIAHSINQFENGENISTKQSSEDERIALENCEVMSWHFTMQRLLQQAQSDQGFSKLLDLVLYLIVGFGILGTVIMLANERKKEFCTMIALGMQRGQLALSVVFELLIMAFIGLILGLMVSYSIAIYFNHNPIHISGAMAKAYIDLGMDPTLPTSIEPTIFIMQVVVILLIVFVTAIYPINKIKRINLSEK